MTIGVQADGSRLHGIDADELEAIALQALDTWLRADCGGGNRPSIAVDSLGLVECNRAEYNDSGNANILMIRDDDWPYAGSASTLGKTHIVFDAASGRIYDSDIELNGSDADISVDDPPAGADLHSILTHEFGHFLGLDHSLDQRATMRADYLPRGTTLRTLAPDDVDGICAIYPPGREPASTSCTPRHGFSAECGGSATSPPQMGGSSGDGCSMSSVRGVGAGRSAVMLLALCLLAVRRRMRENEGSPLA